MSDLLKESEALYAKDHSLINEDRLQALRVASGLGWSGERLPAHMTPVEDERGRIYRWAPPRVPREWGEWKPRPPGALRFVYIRGGEMSSPGGETRRVASFYRTADPIGARLMDAFLSTRDDHEGRLRLLKGHPALGGPVRFVSPERWAAFCEWVGLRSQSRDEADWLCIAGDGMSEPEEINNYWLCISAP